MHILFYSSGLKIKGVFYSIVDGMLWIYLNRVN